MAEEVDRLEFQIAEYLNGRMSPRRQRRFLRRLEEDARLRELLRQYQALESRLGAMGRTEPEGVDYDAHRREILAALERKVLLEPPRRVLWTWRPVAAGLAAAAVVLLAVGVTARLLRPRGKATGETAVVRVLPVAPGLARPGEASVQVRPPTAKDLLAWQLAHRDEGPPALAPSGTVLVSVALNEKKDIDYPMMID